MDLNDQQQTSQTPDDERSAYHTLPNLAEDHITFVELRKKQDLPGIWEELDDILTEHNVYSCFTSQSVTNTTRTNLKSADAQIQKLTRVVELQATIIADMNQAMRQIQTSLQTYQGGSMSSHQGLSGDDVDDLVDSKVRTSLKDCKMDSIVQDKKRKRKRKEEDFAMVNQKSHPPEVSHQHDDHPLISNGLVVERPKGSNSAQWTPHIVGVSSGSPVKTIKKGKSAVPRAKKAGSRCPIELVHQSEEKKESNQP